MTCHSAQDQLQGASLRHPYSQGSFFRDGAVGDGDVSKSCAGARDVKDGPCLYCSTHEASVPR